ncbi:hypothetical protein [Luteimonas terricola]|uniref:Uncharacterized protein n=1 Tax=Luteimonas terricola TaxID=645597 RepID=A0ABQ2EEW2_9GAMM|nr:hypothetical protein [Luteimonas terricola]GGK08774.1 hypothetical protein GCM10011394_17770 [Luteimonas terricola]
MQFALLPMELSPVTVLCELQGRRGAANGITARELVHAITHRYDAAGERMLRSIIQKLREDGHPICAHPAQGYHLAATAEELESACTFLVQRAVTSMRQAAAMKRVAMPDLYGQLGLLKPNHDEDKNHE